MSKELLGRLENQMFNAILHIYIAVYHTNDIVS